ncbi:uncharacterized protein LOC134222893 [Armigeres subalbatus]|uniref:uncharacterized protein LOC134222893 n=1 Tax=Armigeres subalbatus TaxID=124917 RepID=UPI002ED161C6
MLDHRNIDSWVTIDGQQAYIVYKGQIVSCKYCKEQAHTGISCVQNNRLLVQQSYANVAKQTGPRQPPKKANGAKPPSAKPVGQRSVAPPPASLEAFPELPQPSSQTEPSGSINPTASQPTAPIARTVSPSSLQTQIARSTSSSLRTQPQTAEVVLVDIFKKPKTRCDRKTEPPATTRTIHPHRREAAEAVDARPARNSDATTERHSAVAAKEHIYVTHVEKSLDSRLTALRVHDTTICNVYAPSGTAQRAAREEFFNGTLACYLRHHTDNVILAGDFNCVLRACDSSSSNTSPSLKTAVQQLQLYDVWEKLCPRDAGFTYVCRNARSRLDRIYHLYAQLRLAYDGYYLQPQTITTINRLKGEMLALQRNFSHMFMRINETHVAGEPMSIFQLGDRRRKKNTITQLQTGEDEIIVEPQAIEANLFDFFSRLYSEETAENDGNANNGDDFACERVIPRDDPLNEACMEEIQTAEILSAISASAPKRSPGADGIPREFYLRMFDVIHRELNMLMNEALNGNLPHAFVEGVIVLVKKKGGDNTARAYRPISLLNSDYKLLSRILKNRMKCIMDAHRVLSNGQKCLNTKRNIFQATLAVKDRIANLRHHRSRLGKLISFDLENAFDRVRHSFLFETMRSLGFNEELISLLSNIASRSTSRLLINGHLSRSFEITRSVRQGDPLSMHLFVLYLHPLVCRLEQVCGDDLLVAYADDISVIVTSPWQIEAMREVFRRFGLAAGATTLSGY